MVRIILDFWNQKDKKLDYSFYSCIFHKYPDFEEDVSLRQLK